MLEDITTDGVKVYKEVTPSNGVVYTTVIPLDKIGEYLQDYRQLRADLLAEEDRKSEESELLGYTSS